MSTQQRTRLTVLFLFSWAALSAAQEPIDAVHPGGTVRIARLSAPIYPPLARVTRIEGIAELSVEIQPDGRIGSVRALHGNPLLEQAAIDAAKSSEFDCRTKEETLCEYRLYVEFKLDHTAHCQENDEKSSNSKNSVYPQVTAAENRVTVVDQAPIICDPIEIVTKEKRRSFRCLYLWHYRTVSATSSN